MERAHIPYQLLISTVRADEWKADAVPEPVTSVRLYLELANTG